MHNRLDALVAILQTWLEERAPLGVDTHDLLVSEKPLSLNAPLRALTITLDGRPWAIFGITDSSVAPNSQSLISYLARRGRARRAPYLLVSNQRDSMLLEMPLSDEKPSEILRNYPTVVSIAPGSTASLAIHEEIALKKVAYQMAEDLLALHTDGRLDVVIPDADFFVDRLTRAVSILKPTVKQALQTQLSADPIFGKRLAEWAVLQGIPADLRSPEFSEAVVRQAIYRLLGKIIFYQSLHRAMPHLPEMDLAGLQSGLVIPRLKYCFEEAHKIDYHAVFREDVVDDLPFPAAASIELRDLVTDLNTRDFAYLPQDVVGAVFERLIPPEDRHALGQYFTPEALVDLIVALCVRHQGDYILDPTCGTGTFLIRSYDRLKTALGHHDHPELLGQLWGVDIAAFPAELATINLFRQQVGDPGNFPRILNEDFFKIAPGDSYRFPPLKPETVEEKAGAIDEPIPQFDAIVGNFPYIGADRIERSIKGYGNIIKRRLAEDWFESYPEGFTLKNAIDQKQLKRALEQGLTTQQFKDKAEPVITAMADLYVSLFWHAAAFLKPGGRMGIVTSNAWLDVGYGRALQQFFLDHFKIVAILESRCEPWFEQAAVNTVVTILERCSSSDERDNNSVRFVQIKKPLAELIRWDMHLDSLRRWLELDKMRQTIEMMEANGHDVVRPIVSEDHNFRIRTVPQITLRQEVNKSSSTIKWGPLLRAPDVYFDLLQEVKDRLVLLNDIAQATYGSKTGINEFFHFDEVKQSKWKVEEEYLFPLLKSSGDSKLILIDRDTLRLKVFVCRLSKEELREYKALNALRYIEWGEQQVFSSGVQAGLTWPHGATVRSRRPGWYSLPENRGMFANLFLPSALGERLLVKYSREKLIADKRLYVLFPSSGIDTEEMAAIMNSGLGLLFMELAGRVSLGDGALELTIEDANAHLYLPDIRNFDKNSRMVIKEAFQPLLNRPIGSIFQEVEQPDRQILDRLILQTMGLDPDVWLPRIYEGLTTLVGQRVQIAKMRGEAKRSRPKKAAGRVNEQVLQDILPNGPLIFPDDFWSPQARKGTFHELVLPPQPLVHKGHLWGKEELQTEGGEQVFVKSKFELQYVLFAQAAGQKIVRIPEAPVEISRTVNNYKQYLRDLREQLSRAYFTRTLDQVAAERFTNEVWQRLKLPEVEI